MITAMLWIGVEANEIVGLLTALGIFWKIPTAIMGLTFLAWANSIGDLVADISLAKLGKARTAVAACFGSPLLNIPDPTKTPSQPSCIIKAASAGEISEMISHSRPCISSPKAQHVFYLLNFSPRLI